MSDRILATDLDGTLIPLKGRRDHVADLKRLKQLLDRVSAMLLFVTGRHYRSVIDAITQFDLPAPDWILCDVGTSIYRKSRDDGYEFVPEYAEHQARIVSGFSRQKLFSMTKKYPGLHVQEQEKQGPFKLSFYADQAQLDLLSDRLAKDVLRLDAPWSIVSSVDPFTGDGLIDFLPKNVSKAHALSWWTQYSSLSAEAIVFAGDSGNDLAALTAGYQTIVVGNACRVLAQKVFDAHRSLGLNDRLCLSELEATSGVLDGCKCFWF